MTGAYKLFIVSNASKIPAKIAVYSDDRTIRETIIAALGRRLADDLPDLAFMEFATADALRLHNDSRKSRTDVDLFILDGEATPEGGMGLSRELKDELFNCPPVLLITGRADDAWLASWSLADGVVTHPIDPFTIATKATELLRNKLALA
jgi:DNA-binding response OmpR family regulator